MRDSNQHVWQAEVIGPIAAAVSFVGWCGVTLFFVLSGFLLFMPYARALVSGGEWPNWRRYYVRRIFRIWPGYFFALFVLMFWFHPPGFVPLQHWYDVVLFLTFFMDSTPQTVQAINGPFWTLAVEWQFYLILPWLALAIRLVVQRGAARRRLGLIVACLGCVALWGVLTRAWGQSWIESVQQPLVLPLNFHKVALFFFYGQHGKFLEDFAVGMFISVCYVLAQDKSQSNAVVVKFFKQYSDWFWAVGVLWLFLLGIWFVIFPANAVLQLLLGQYAVFSELAYAVGYGCCLIALLFGPAYQRRPLEWGGLCWLGQISYGLYIWHLPILHFFQANLVAISRNWPGLLMYSLNWGFFAAVVVPFCYLVYLFIERPGINVGVKLLKGGASKRQTEVPIAKDREKSMSRTPG